MSQDTNDQLVLISGESTTGKSASLMNIRNQSKWLYLNTEAGKRLPFRNDFVAKRIEDPYQIHEAFDYATAHGDKFDGIIIDTVTFMMDMFESMYIRTAVNTQKAWGDFSDFFKVLMHQKVVAFEKPVLMLAHTKKELNEAAMQMDVSVPIKGGLKNNGIEAYFSTVVSTKRAPLKMLQEFDPPLDTSLLHVSEDDELLGFKHVFQTRLTKETVGERIRSPMGLFDRNQTFIDNDAQLLLDHLHKFYN
jgi:hypothetical protein